MSLRFDDAFAPRMEKLEESVQVIRGLWTSEAPFSFHGTHLELKDAPFWPKPVQRPAPPIWLGGTSRRVRRLLARHADGWSPAMPHGRVGPTAYAEGLAEIRQLAEDDGRDPGAITPGLLPTLAIGRTRAEGAERASVLLRRPDYASQSLDELAAAGSVIYGDPDDCVRGIQGYTDAGVEYLTLNFAPFGSADAAHAGIELVAEQIAPRLG